MRISCPACAALYEVPQELLVQSRVLCCAQCGQSWTIGGEGEKKNSDEDEIGAEQVAEISPEELTEASEPLSREGMRLAAAPGVVVTSGEAMIGTPALWLGGWAASLALVVVCALSLWRWQSEITHFWPPSARFFTYCARLALIG